MPANGVRQHLKKVPGKGLRCASPPWSGTPEGSPEGISGCKDEQPFDWRAGISGGLSPVAWAPNTCDRLFFYLPFTLHGAAYFLQGPQNPLLFV